jgi:hypothetical protein
VLGVIPAVVLSVGVIADDAVEVTDDVTETAVRSVGAIADVVVTTVLAVISAVVLSVGAIADVVVTTVLGVIPAVVLSVGAIAEADVAMVPVVIATAVLSTVPIVDDVVGTVLADTDADDVIDGAGRDATASALGAVIVILVVPDVIAGSSKSIQETTNCLETTPENVPVTHSSRAEVEVIDANSAGVMYLEKF